VIFWCEFVSGFLTGALKNSAYCSKYDLEYEPVLIVRQLKPRPFLIARIFCLMARLSQGVGAAAEVQAKWQDLSYVTRALKFSPRKSLFFIVLRRNDRPSASMSSQKQPR
jgi:hypothetical protein